MHGTKIKYWHRSSLWMLRCHSTRIPIARLESLRSRTPNSDIRLRISGRAALHSLAHCTKRTRESSTTLSLPWSYRTYTKSRPFKRLVTKKGKEEPRPMERKSIRIVSTCRERFVVAIIRTREEAPMARSYRIRGSRPDPWQPLMAKSLRPMKSVCNKILELSLSLRPASMNTQLNWRVVDHSLAIEERDRSSLKFKRISS